MADVGLGQEIIATARRRSKIVRDAMSDSRPVTRAMKEHGGYLHWESGRSLVMPALSDQNDSVDWVGETGQAPMTENNVLDGPEGSWYFLLGSLQISKAEELKNRSPSQYVPLIKSKTQALEKTQKNKFHEGILSSGTGSGGLQMPGLASHVSTTPTTGTVLGIDRSSSDAIWFRNQKFDTSGDWSDGAVDSGNVHRFLDKGIDATSLDDAEPNVQVGLLGATHWGFLTAATRPFQHVVTEKTSIKVGQNVIYYRGVPCYLSGGLNYSGFSAQTVTRTYLLNVEEGGFNVIFMEGAEFEMLQKVNSSDQAVASMLMFTMVSCMLGGYARRCWVGFD